MPCLLRQFGRDIPVRRWWRRRRWRLRLWLADPAAPRSPQVSHDDLHAGGYRDGDQRSEHAQLAAADQHRDQDEQWVHLDRAAVDDRLEDVVLYLLVDDEVDRPDDHRGGEVRDRRNYADAHAADR